MSRRFVAPPAESRDSTGSIQTISSPNPSIKQDFLPPPSHPALARPRVPSPGPETHGALNRPLPPPPPSHPSRAPSPAPPIPSRTPSSTVHSTDPVTETTISTQSIPADPPALQANPVYSNGHTIAQPQPRLDAPQSFLAPDVTSPTLVVTPVTTSGLVDSIPVIDQDFQKTETLPPYSSEPDLSAQTHPAVVIEPPPITAPLIPISDNTLGLQNQGHLSTTSIPRIPPPLHPTRQPAPSPSLAAPGLRHRALSSTNISSARTLDSGISPRRPQLEHSRRGSGASVLTLKDENLTDDDLRKMYDAEEVERYLRLFASRVNEVTLDPEHPEANTPMMHEEEGEWVSVSSSIAWPWARNTGPLPPNLVNPQTPFQYIAALVYPYLNVSRPQSSETKRKFKLNRAASSAQRLYLAAYPAYVPLLVYLGHLSTWRDPRKSAFWCAVFWTAWAGGFLSQIIVGRILYLLYTGGHVTREEIRRRRVAAKEAEKLGKAIEGGIPGVGITGELGVWEVTKLVTGMGKRKGKKAKTAAVEIRSDVVGQGNGDSEEAEDMEDWKLMLVDLADELADLHERIKNIFLHRRPELTRFYIILVTLVFIGTFLVQDSSRVVTMILGFWFWFVPPVVKQLPKLPSPFSSAPTDAEVAMELISKRVERGERVVPERISRRKKKSVVEPGKLQVMPSGLTSRSTTDLTDTSFPISPSTTSLLEGASSEDEADVGVVVTTNHTTAPQEDKLRKGAVRAWNWLGRTKQLIDQTRGVEPKAVFAHASADQSFPAQHHSRPGMLMISSSLLTFTPLFTSNNSQSQSQIPQDTRTVKVDIDHLRGVKKVSPGGLSVRYAKGSEVVEEKFLLVVGRDEAFATLVGWGGGRWKHV